MKVFVTGATGYIGGSVSTRLLEQGHAVIGLARSAEAAVGLKQRGIEPLMGDINAYTPFVEVVKRVDAVINAANSDNAFVVHALLTGLRGTGKTLIQTSGSSVVGKYDNGEASEDTFDEDSAFTPQPEKAMRVAIDHAVLAAAKENVRAIVIRPALIYGRGIGVSSTSVQLPRLIDVARKHGVPRHVGRGLNIWGHVHIEDVAALYLLALEKASAGALFYAENGEANFKSVTPHARDGRQDAGLADRRSGRGDGTRRLFELRVEQPRARQALARARLAAEGTRAHRRDRARRLRGSVRQEIAAPHFRLSLNSRASRAPASAMRARPIVIAAVW
jgi:nucleoside-diphosphate-sugar epimerase